MANISRKGLGKTGLLVTTTNVELNGSRGKAGRSQDILKISLSGNFWKSMLEFSTRKEPVVLRLFSLFTPWRVLVSKSEK